MNEFLRRHRNRSSFLILLCLLDIDEDGVYGMICGGEDVRGRG